VKRETITNGIAWTRFILVPFIIYAVSMVFTSDDKFAFLLFSLTLLGVFFLLSKARKLKYDDEKVIKIKGAHVLFIPFSEIIELRKSKSKVNGSRFWIMTYLDENKNEKKIRYFHGIFQGFGEEFHKKLRMANPSVNIIHTSNYSLMVDSYRKWKHKKNSD
jgi:hypothetical protein